jgi:sterol desaturase/sphingolipid hydroxylase (fatty acid hydroxylase superfamily)
VPEIISRNPAILLAFLALALVEYVWRTRIARRGYDWRASLGSLGVAVIQFAIKPLTAGFVAAIFTAVYTLAPVKLPLNDWRVWVAAFFAVEFTYYWFHRTSHTVNWFWATHAVHHSANEMTLPAAIRLGWTGQVTGAWVFFLPLLVIGFPPLLVVGLLGANLIYQYSLHTEAIGKLWAPIEYILNTPSHHRAHHASNEGWLDTNYGGVLIIFDRMFGTFAAEPDGGGLTYGLVTPLRSHNPGRIAFNQWLVLGRAVANADSCTKRLGLLIGAPRLLDQESPQRSADPGYMLGPVIGRSLVGPNPRTVSRPVFPDRFDGEQ